MENNQKLLIMMEVSSKGGNVLDIEIKLLKNCLRWMGQRYQTSKSTAFGELEGSRKVGRPLLRYKDTCKMDLQRSEVLNERNTVVNDRDKWKPLKKLVKKRRYIYVV